MNKGGGFCWSVSDSPTNIYYILHYYCYYYYYYYYYYYHKQ